MKKVKIAVLATYVGNVNRGAETFVIELVKQLRQYYDITVFSTGICNEIASNIKKIDVKKSKIYSIHKKLYFEYKIYQKVCNKTYFLIPDVIYQKKFTKKVFKDHINNENWNLIFPNNGIWGTIYANKLRARKNTPYIYTGHGGIGKGEELILKTLPNKYITLTNKHYKWAMQYSKDLEIIYNGIDCNKFNISKSDKIDKGHKLVIDVGALTAFKRHKLAIDAISELDENVKLLILGKGEMYEELSRYGKSKLGDRFEIKSVPYKDMKDYYNMADAFTLPSYNEPFGIVYLEAMAMNIPVVAPNDSARREIIGQAGILCNCESKKEYSEAIKNALETSWGNIPKEQALKFDWNIISKQYNKLIEEVIKNNGYK